MAKGKKKDNAATDRNKMDRDQALIEEGTTPETTKAEYSEEDHEDDHSTPGEGQDKESGKRPGKGITNDKEVQESAREAGHEPAGKRQKDLNVGEKVIREATRKSQSPASARVTRKEPSKASPRASGKSRTNSATRSGMQGKTKATSTGRGASRAKSTKAPASKQKTKARAGR